LILLDANALLALLKDEPAAGEVAALLRGGDCATPASCLSEVVDRLIRRSGVRAEDVVDRLEPLIDASLTILPIENRAGWQAGEFRGIHYGRGSTDLSLADCILLAVAGPGDELATADRDLATVAANHDISVIALPDSKGNRSEND
jgi:predicted nucleic acid-binding protein